MGARPRPTWRDRVRRATLAGLLAGLFAASAVAPAGVPLVDGLGVPFRWDLDLPGQPNVDTSSSEVTYFADPKTLTDPIQFGKTPAQAVADAIASWEVGTTRIRFREDRDRKASGRDASDRVNYIGWTNGGLGPLTFAVTFPTRSGSRVTDMDILLNDRDFVWSTANPGRGGEADVESLVAHEWGHALGADHVPLRGSTMYFATETGSLGFRTLSADDRALVGSIYPNGVFEQTTGALAGRVRLAGAADHRAIHVTALSVVTGEPEASALTGPDGTYEIRGLPAGSYRVIASPTVPLRGAMNAYWHAGNSDFLPAVLGATGPGGGPVTTLAVSAGATTAAPELEVRLGEDPFEPNEGYTQAAPIELGRALGARLDGGGDEDWFAFDGTAGQRITVIVAAWHLGSTADPSMRITDSLGRPLVTVDDVRGRFPYLGTPEGTDLDAREVGFVLPRTDRFRVGLRNQTVSRGPDSFYVLMVTPASDAPNASLSRVEAQPDRIDADGVSRATVVVEPRKETGESVGAGAEIVLLHDGAGVAGPVVDHGNGLYSAEVTAPGTAGVDRVTVRVTTALGTATLADAATIVYLGPADGARTSFAAAPRRIDADGLARAEVRITPRDARGEPLGPGRDVVLGLQGPDGTQLGPVADAGDGSYAAELTAPTSRGAADVTASIDGVALPAVVRIDFGHPLDEVVAQARLDVAAFLGDVTLRRGARRALGAAAKRLDAAAALVEAGTPESLGRALGKTKSAVAKLAAARKAARGALPALGTEPELARAIREAADDGIAASAPGSDRDRRRLDRATALFARGDDAFAASDLRKAAARWLRALRLAP